MDQEAEIMKQSMARREAQAAAEEAEGEEEEPQQPLRKVGSGGRGTKCGCLEYDVPFSLFDILGSLYQIHNVLQLRRWCSG